MIDRKTNTPSDRPDRQKETDILQRIKKWFWMLSNVRESRSVESA